MPTCCRAEHAELQTCPRCGTRGRPVGRETVAALATLEVPAEALASPYWLLCPAPDCPVVYHAGTTVIAEDEVRVPVHWKRPDLDVPLCYCFGHTRRDIAGEIGRTGRSTAFTTISAAVRAGRCACDVRNPSGQCCLGDVRRFERAAGGCDGAEADDAEQHHERRESR